MRRPTPLAPYAATLFALSMLLGYASGASADDAPPGAAPQAPTVTASAIAAGGRDYNVFDCADPASAPKAFRVVIPAGLGSVRGLLVNCNYGGGDSRGDWTFCHYYREFMHLHNFALVASAGDIPHAAAYQAFRRCLTAVGKASGHAELVNAPYVAIGFSAGGGFASTLMTLDPDRTIAVAILGARYNFDHITRPAPAAVLGIPSVLITGEQEQLNSPAVDGRYKVDEVFLPNRPLDGRLAWLERRGIGHGYDDNRQDVLAMPLLDLAVRTRYPHDGDPAKGPVAPLPVDYAAGWIADHTSWHSGLTRIAPAKSFAGDLGRSSWLQSEDLAFVYRAYATYDQPLTITAPSPCGPGTPTVPAGSDVTVVVDAGKLANWRTLAFYDGARRLATVTKTPTQTTVTGLTPGYHVFSVLGTDAAGNVHTSDPVMVVVAAPR